MGTTTNNGWPTPVATDLVKDGWEAIKDLGDAIDTTLGVYAPSTPGLTLINTTSFSAVASQSLPANTFSATYDRYRILISGVVSGAETICARMRASGTDNTTASSYVSQKLNVTSTTVSADRETGTYWAMTGWDTTLVNSLEIYLINPFAATPTGNNFYALRSTSSAYYVSGGGTHNQSTSYDSLTFFPFSGNITGTVSVYGFSK